MPANQFNLSLNSIQGFEEISRGFEYTLKFSRFKNRESIKPGQLLGKKCGFSVEMSDTEKKRYLHGLVTEFQEGPHDGHECNYQIKPGFIL